MPANRKPYSGWELTYRDREVTPGSNGMARRTGFIIDVSRANTTFEATPYMQDTRQGGLEAPIDTFNLLRRHLHLAYGGTLQWWDVTGEAGIRENHPG